MSKREKVVTGTVSVLVILAAGTLGYMYGGSAAAGGAVFAALASIGSAYMVVYG